MKEQDYKDLSNEALWDIYAKGKSVDLKNELVLRYIPNVKRIVKRMMPTYEGYSNFDDMLSCGVLGLMDAIDKYDAARGVKFEYYATTRIRGEIIDNIRKQDWAPSSLRRKIKEISDAYISLENKLMRSASDYEVAEYLGMDADDVNKILGQSQMFNVVHFEMMMQDNSAWESAVPSHGESFEEEIEKKESVEIMGDLIDKLPEKEKLVLSLYYYEEMTLKEIAGVLNVSESRASQIHSKAILKLRSSMNRAYSLK